MNLNNILLLGSTENKKLVSKSLILLYFFTLPNLSFSNENTCPVLNGQEGDAKSLPFVVAIHFETSDDPDAIATGTVLGPRWIVTAAHVFDEDIIYERSYIVAGQNNMRDINQEGQEQFIYQIQHVEIHPYYRPNIGLEDNDIALILLDRDLPGTIDYNGDPALIALGAEILLAGYGNTEPDYDDDGELYMGINFVDAVNDYALAMDNYHNLPEGPALAIPSFGDSGGPVWIEQANGTRLLVAIIHDSQIQNYFYDGTDTRHRYRTARALYVAPYRNWIAAITGIGPNGVEEANAIDDPLEGGPPITFDYPLVDEMPPLVIVPNPNVPSAYPFIVRAIETLVPVLAIVGYNSVQQAMPQPLQAQQPTPQLQPPPRVDPDEDEQKVPYEEDPDGVIASEQEHQALLRRRANQARTIRRGNIDDCLSKGPF